MAGVQLTKDAKTKLSQAEVEVMLNGFCCHVRFLDTGETERFEKSTIAQLFRNVNLAFACYDIESEDAQKEVDKLVRQMNTHSAIPHVCIPLGMHKMTPRAPRDNIVHATTLTLKHRRLNPSDNFSLVYEHDFQLDTILRLGVE